MHEITREQAAGVLLRLGVPMRTRGWDWLIEAVMLTVSEPQLDERMLYARIAQEAGVSTAAVRSACARSVTRAASRGLPGLPGDLSVGGFLALAAELLRRED